MNHYTSIKFITALLVLCAAVSSCRDSEEDEDGLNPYVQEPAYAILLREGSLHLLSVVTFYEDPGNIDNDLMVLHFDSFSPASTNVEPDEDKDEDKTLNDLGWIRSSWDEDSLTWKSNTNPKSSETYGKTRPYRLLTMGGLSAPVTALNQPIYEAVDENVYERQLAATFVWDFGSYTDETGEDISGEEIAEYESLNLGSNNYELLPYATIWGENVPFSSGAKIYGATRSVATDTLVIEAVEDLGSFSLTKTRFGTGIASIEDALSAYPQDVQRLEYRYTLDYSSYNKLYISFETSNDIAYVYNSASGSVYFEVPYTVHTDPSYIEIDTASLADDARIILGGLPTYFNPIIAGPYTSDGSYSGNISNKSYFYGKHYIKTDAVNRLQLTPVFFLNNQAKTDVENTFRSWRQTRHFEEGK